MRADTRPVLLASKLPASDVSARPGERTTIVCPACRTWCFVGEGRVRPHNTEVVIGPRPKPGTSDPRCPESFRRFALDLTYTAAEAKRATEAAEVGARRATRVHLKPKPAQAPAVHALRAVRGRAPQRAQTAGWSAAEVAAWNDR